MDTLVSLFSALARGVRWTFDLAGMAVGVAPSQLTVGDSAALPVGDRHAPNVRVNSPFDDDRLSRHHREALGHWDSDT